MDKFNSFEFLQCFHLNLKPYWKSIKKLNKNIENEKNCQFMKIEIHDNNIENK